MTDPVVGRTLDGRYHVTERLARGGMATVYLATDTRLDRQVAVKIMHPHLAEDESFQTRFYREAKSAASISHSAIVAVYDQGHDSGTTYLVMEYVPGRTLRDVIRDDAPVTIRQALSIVEQMLEGLGAAHASGLVHRDVKPENVLMTPHNGVKMADFGLARAAAQDGTNSTTGVMMGTIAYIAPEVVNEAGADNRTDLYAVGVVLFELLTGKQPFVGDTAITVAYKHVQEDFPLPSSLVAGVPTQLDELVLWATAKDPAQRPDDAWEMLTDLKHIRSELSGPQIDSHPVPLDSPHVTQVLSSNPPPVVPGEGNRTTAMPRTHIPKMTQVHDEPVYVAPAGRGRSSQVAKILSSIAVISLVAVLLAVAGVWYFFVGPGSFQETPNVVGQSEQAAATVLKGQNLEVEFERSSSEQIPKGQVMASKPPASADVRKGGKVVLVISTGSEFAKAPAVTGLTEKEAVQALAEVGIKPGQVDLQFHESIAEGKVIAQGIKPGARLNINQQVVDLTISKGREPLTIPNVVNKKVSTAKKTITKIGFSVTVKQEYSSEYPSGQVMAQSPADGQGFRGEVITLTVSAGPEEVTVPDLSGLSPEEAQAKLRELGLTARVMTFANISRRVFSQSPSAGTTLKPGETVTLNVW